MANAVFTTPEPVNEPVLGYLPGSPERAALKAELRRQRQGDAGARGDATEIPLVIGGREVRPGRLVEAVVPHDHRRVLARAHSAGESETLAAIEAAKAARRDWAAMPWEARAAIFLKAAELLAGPWRQRLNAATMLNQSKTCHQAEIDAACEMIDFFRFNAKFAERIYRDDQPLSPRGVWNRLEMRPLEGFVYAVTPFNFTSIAGNLPAAPALMGNTVVWKPSPHALHSNYLVMKLLEAAGLPPGVINFVPGDAPTISRVAVAHPDFAGLHFTGSTAVFRQLWLQIAENLPRLRDYPRVVGETGGKDFLVAHASADPEALVVAIVRGAYEFQGQKCSALSRCYLPKSLWHSIREKLLAEIASIKVGDVADFSNFMGAVIHRAAFDRCCRHIEQARRSGDAKVLTGGACDDATGYFVSPTLIQSSQPRYETMCEEIFGPILTVHVYEDNAFEEALRWCDETSPYGLTGSIFATDRVAVEKATQRLRYAAGNFYINDKPTGAIVGQQPFGGSRGSGTNDKAGSALNLLRWVSPRTIKETFDPPRDYRMGFTTEP